MATATISHPFHSEASYTITAQSSTHSAITTPSILEEVQAAQIHIRERLANAIRTPPASTPPSLLPTVPIIDLGPSFNGSLDSRLQVARQIREACLTVGFFQISNHSLTSSATAGVLEQAHRFFHDLSAEQKDTLHIRHSPLFRGFEPGDYTYVNPDNSRSSDPEKKDADSQEETKQGFNFGYEEGFDPIGGDEKYVELDGQPPKEGHTNVWPSEKDLLGFKAAVAEYYKQVLTLSRHLFRLFALSLNLEESHFDNLTTHPGGIGRLIYYPAQPPASSQDTEPVAKMGLGAHTDYECFTILLADENPGLEILFPPSPLTDNKPLWCPCPVRPGTITVNVADFLMRWTNGLYKSTVHRVVSWPGQPARYSVPFFFSINYDAEVEALPERIVGKSAFRPMKAGEYVLERLKATKALGEGVDDVGVVD